MNQTHHRGVQATQARAIGTFVLYPSAAPDRQRRLFDEEVPRWHSSAVSASRPASRKAASVALPGLDAGGIGFVADARGRSSRDIVKTALGGLACVKHRGALAADGGLDDVTGRTT